MKVAGIIANLDKAESAGFAVEIINWLQSMNIVPVITKELKAHISPGCLFSGCREADVELMCGVSDFIIVLGGDGTILRAARSVSRYNVPMIGINLGTLGYLTDCEKAQGLSSLKKVVDGEYKTEKRMMLEASVDGKPGTGGERLLALNDICILRGAVSKVINFSLHVNEVYMDTFRADGIIISTPTGSTAYNLAAGGPVLKPDIELIAITPVCAHKMYSRSWVVSANDSVSIRVGDCHGNIPMLSLDGQEFLNLEKGQTVDIVRSDVYTTLIKTGDLSFYDILRMKLHQ